MVEKYTTVCWALGEINKFPEFPFIFSYYKIAQLQHTFLSQAKHCCDFCGHLCAFKTKILLCVSNDFHIIIHRQTTRKKFVTEALVICIMLSLCPFIKQIKILFIQIIRRSIWSVEQIQ